MPKYKVITTCYFRKKVFEAGEIVELEGDDIPRHLELFDEKKEKAEKKPEKKDEPSTYSGLQKKQAKGAKTGFAGKLSDPISGKDQ